MKCHFFEEDGTLAKVGSIFKPTFHNKVKLVQVLETQCLRRFSLSYSYHYLIAENMI
jgi:hypothetical protein